MALAAAGIGAAGSIIGGITGGKGAKKAAKAQLQATQAQISATNANRQQLVDLSQPAIDRGNQAASTFSGLLGLGDNPAAAQAALATYRNSTGYQDLINTGLNAVNSSAYARGMGDSGATLKALQAKGMSLADQNQQQYLGNLNTLIQTGNSAIGNVAGVSTNATNANNAALGNAADASSNAALAQAANWQQAIKNFTNIGSNFASSYGGRNAYGISGAGGIY